MSVGRAWSGAGHVGPAESDGQLQVLLLLEPQPPQPLLLLTLALPLDPLQLLALISKLEQREKHLDVDKHAGNVNTRRKKYLGRKGR